MVSLVSRLHFFGALLVSTEQEPDFAILVS